MRPPKKTFVFVAKEDAAELLSLSIDELRLLAPVEEFTQKFPGRDPRRVLRVPILIC